MFGFARRWATAVSAGSLTESRGHAVVYELDQPVTRVDGRGQHRSTQAEAESSRDRSTRSRLRGRHEGSSERQEDLRQVQGRTPQGRRAHDLREPAPQAASGLREESWHVSQASTFPVASTSPSPSRTSTASATPPRAKICAKAGIPETKKVDELTDADVKAIRDAIEADYQGRGRSRAARCSMNIKRLMDLGCYRGLRHRKGLPVHGQRTHTNARTRKGPRKGLRASAPDRGPKLIQHSSMAKQHRQHDRRARPAEEEGQEERLRPASPTSSRPSTTRSSPSPTSTATPIAWSPARVRAASRARARARRSRRSSLPKKPRARRRSTACARSPCS